MKHNKFQKSLVTDHSLTPMNCEARGYEWVKDILYDREAPLEAMQDIISLVNDKGYKLGQSASDTTRDYMQGLYRPLP